MTTKTKETVNILDRFSGAVRFSAEIECAPDALPSVKLGLAVKIAIAKRANLQDADLRGADLRGADLQGANLWGADLGRAYLQGADLWGANLQDADLRGADLGGAYLGGAYLQGADLWGEKITRLIGRVTRLIESYEFFAFELEAGGYKIAAGCRWFSDAEFRAHVAEEYPGSVKASETLAILDFIKARAAALGVSAEVSAPAAIADAPENV